MMRGIAILGLNGSGKSTLAHALAKRTGYFEMDVEDYYFPEQASSRRSALENCPVMDTEYLGDLPFSSPRTKCEVEAAILKDIRIHLEAAADYYDNIKAYPGFILSGVTMNWQDEILSRIDIAFWIQTPLEERLQRIQTREEKRFGARVLAGGDMFAQQMEFRNMVKNRDVKTVEESVKKLNCPVVILDGSLPATDNLEIIIDRMTGTR